MKEHTRTSRIRQGMKMLLGQRIKVLREKLHLSQTELASQAGVTRSLINKLEDGSTSNPTLDKLQRIASALNVSVAYLIGEGHPIPENLRHLALQDNLDYKELDIPILMTFRDKESTTVEEWRHILHSAKEFPELYRRLGMVMEEEIPNEKAV